MIDLLIVVGMFVGVYVLAKYVFPVDRLSKEEIEELDALVLKKSKCAKPQGLGGCKKCKCDKRIK